MTVFLLTLLVVALCVFGLCFNIVFRKDGKFPQFDVGSNEKMREKGILCMREVQDNIPLTSGRDTECSGEYSEACKGCGFNKKQ